MASTLSFSQSFSNSLIVHQHRYDQRHKKHSIVKQEDEDQQKQQLLRQSQEIPIGCLDGDSSSKSGIVSESCETRGDVGLVKQIMMTATSFGYSCTVEFEALYGVMSMQYFGVPVYLVSVPGLISGVANTFSVPLLGRFSDRGPNPLKRKLLLVAFTTLCLLVGFVILGACSWVKLTQVGDGEQHSAVTTLSSIEYKEHLNNTPIPSINYTFTPNKTVSSPPSSNVDYPETVIESNTPGLVITIFATIPFFLFDTGYDISLAMSRASVLEVVPVHKRNSVLNMSGMMTGIAGMLTAVIGIVDFPTIFGSVLHTDGYALTLILFSVAYGLCGVSASACSIVTIWKMYCNNLKLNSKKSKNDFGISTKRNEIAPLMNEVESYQNNDTNEINPRTTNMTRNKSDLKSETAYHCSQQSPSMENESLPIKRDKACYASIDPPSQQDQALTHSWREQKREIKTLEPSKQIITQTNTSHPSVTNEYYNDNASVPGNKIDGTGLMLSISKSYEKALGEIHLQKLRDNGRKINSSFALKAPTPRASLCNARFILCLAAIYLCMASVCVTTMYQSNTVTMEVCKGDPLAAPGSPGRIRYEQGVRLSSFGILAAYISFLVVYMASPIIVGRFGTVGMFLTSNTLATAGAILFCAYPTSETYFCMMVTYGLNKFTMLALGFIMATIYAPIDDIPDTENAPTSKIVGQVMALVALSTPVGYILMSATMGPIMAATGSALPPVYFCVLSGSGAIILGIVLRVLK